MAPDWPRVPLSAADPDLTSRRGFGRLRSSMHLQHVTVVLCTLAVIAYISSAFLPMRVAIAISWSRCRLR